MREEGELGEIGDTIEEGEKEGVSDEREIKRF